MGGIPSISENLNDFFNNVSKSPSDNSNDSFNNVSPTSSANTFSSIFSSGSSASQADDNSNSPWNGFYTRPDPAVYDCHRPLSGLPGTGTHNGPDWGINPLNHEYPCTYIDGDWNCGSTTPTGGMWSPGTPTDESTDWYHPDRCDLVSTDPCVADCVSAGIDDSYRPDWGLLGPGENCHEWTDDLLNNCVDGCSTGNLSQFNDTYDLDYGTYDLHYIWNRDVDYCYDVDWGAFECCDDYWY